MWKDGNVAAHLEAKQDAFLCDCLHGLNQTQKSLPCKWLYDDRGSELFEAICGVPEYYPARTEQGLLESATDDLAGRVDRGTTLIELGSGASRKTRLLLEAIGGITNYVPVDISAAELERASRAIRRDYPGIMVTPVHADFSHPRTLAMPRSDGPRFGFFPGSTIGNMAPAAAVLFLAELQTALGVGSRLLLGVDLLKDPAVLVPAYDDAAGITAEFNRNILARVNRELACDIDLAGFVHRAVWNAAQSRIEMHLVALRPQTIALGPVGIELRAGETIHTENSYKLPQATLEEMFAEAGWTVEQLWRSDEPAFLLALLHG